MVQFFASQRINYIHTSGQLVYWLWHPKNQSINQSIV